MDSSLLPSSPKYKNARASLLIVLAFSLVNVFAVFANYYFYFSSRIALVLDAIGAPKSCNEIGIDKKILPMTFKTSKDIRDKYVLPRLCWDLGIIDEIVLD